MTPPLFHISFNKALPTYLYPRQPMGLKDPDKIDQAPTPSDSMFAENLPPRISFAPSVTECWRAIWPNIYRYFSKYKYPHMDMYVYILEKGNESNMLRPEQLTKDMKLWDAHFTNEYCFLTKVRVKKIAKIRIYNTHGKHAKKIHPYNLDHYPVATGAPDPEIKVLRVIDSSKPLVLKPTTA